MIPHLPIIRNGAVYRSLAVDPIPHIQTGEPIAEISLANTGLIRRDLRPNANLEKVLRAHGSDDRIAVCRQAAAHFREGSLPVFIDGRQQTPDDYVRILSDTTGMPYVLCRRNMEKIANVLTNMGTIVNGLTAGAGLNFLDNGVSRVGDVMMSYYPLAQHLGVILPNNSPGVNSLWLPAVALRTPVILKPGRRDPWTPWRIMQAFIAARLPAEALGFYPCDHEGADVIVGCCDRSLLFGDEQTVERYRLDSRIEVHGPGYSKIVIGDDAVDQWPEYMDMMIESIVDNGGRSCVNASSIVVSRHAKDIAESLSERLATYQPRPMDDDEAMLTPFPDRNVCEAINCAIDNDLSKPGAVEITANYRSGPRLVVYDSMNYLLPTVILCDEPVHPLGNREFLFPYVSVVEISQNRILQHIGKSLTVTAVTHDEEFQRELLNSSLIDRLNFGLIPTTSMAWDQPHEGNLFAFLFKRRAIQINRGWWHDDAGF